MHNSARILVQRYLDGELSDVERQTFLDDLSQDSHLATLLDNEVHLDVAIINDAYSIEVPESVRASVLAAVAGTPQTTAPEFVKGRGAAPFVFLATLLMLISSIAPNDGHVTNRMAAGIATPAIAEQRYDEKPRTIEAIKADKPASAVALTTASAATPHVIAQEVGITTAPVHSAQPSPAISEPQTAHVTTTSLGPTVPTVPTSQAGSTIQPSAANISALLAPSIVSLRYAVSGAPDQHIYVEGGVMRSARVFPQIVNGIAAVSTQAGNLPFALVGIEGALIDIPSIERRILASLALGVTSIGPMASADLSTRLANIGPVSLCAGLRMQAILDLRNHRTLTSQMQPTFRISLPIQR